MIVHDKCNSKTKELAEALLGVANTKEMVDLLEGLLTKREIAEMSCRIQIIKMLKEGIPQREISKKLGVGIATVTRGSKEISKGRFETL